MAFLNTIGGGEGHPTKEGRGRMLRAGRTVGIMILEDRRRGRARVSVERAAKTARVFRGVRDLDRDSAPGGCGRALYGNVRPFWRRGRFTGPVSDVESLAVAGRSVGASWGGIPLFSEGAMISTAGCYDSGLVV